MRLYCHPLSSNSRRVLLTAAELGVPLDRVFVDLAAGEQRSAAYRRLNPMGLVPLLDDAGFLLWESHAIMAYLADRTPGQTLYPHDARERADVNRWLFWSAYHFTPAVGTLSRERVSKRMVGGIGRPDPDVIARGEALFIAAAEVLDTHLAGRAWVAGERRSLADFAIAAPLMHTAAAGLPVAGFARIEAWFSRIRALDAWQSTESATHD